MSDGHRSNQQDSLEALLICPKCGEANTRYVRIIKLEDQGKADCSSCNENGPVQLFLPKER